MKKNIKFSSFLKVLVLAVGVASLVACSTTKNPSASDANGVQATGMGDGSSSFGSDGISEAGDPNRLKAPYNQRYHFDFNKFTVLPDDIASINAQANYLAAHPSSRVRLEGNADERGSREYNVALGWKRARAVADVLKQSGVTQSQIAMVSYGKEKPLVMGHDEDAYSQNRRVELIYEEK
jgi:peptidoglycan-associated lipoprotein